MAPELKTKLKKLSTKLGCNFFETRIARSTLNTFFINDNKTYIFKDGSIVEATEHCKVCHEPFVLGKTKNVHGVISPYTTKNMQDLLILMQFSIVLEYLMNIYQKWIKLHLEVKNKLASNSSNSYYFLIQHSTNQIGSKRIYSKW